MDGVIADLFTEWVRRYNVQYNDRLTIADITAWDTHLFVKPECGVKVYDFLCHPDLYEGVEPLPGAAAGVARLRELGHDVAFVTSCTYGMVDQKSRWLERHGFSPATRGRYLPADLVVAHTKRRVAADVLIDDRADTIKDWVTSDHTNRAILVEYPYNRDLDLTSLDWQRVKRASAFPEPSAAWPAIVEQIERMS